MTRTMLLASLMLAATALAGCDSKPEDSSGEFMAEPVGDDSPLAEAAPTESLPESDDRGGNETNRQ